jgi:hypothetical protein
MPFNPFIILLPIAIVGATVPFGVTTLGFSYSNYIGDPSYVVSARLPIGVIYDYPTRIGDDNIFYALSPRLVRPDAKFYNRAEMYLRIGALSDSWFGSINYRRIWVNTKGFNPDDKESYKSAISYNTMIEGGLVLGFFSDTFLGINLGAGATFQIGNIFEIGIIPNIYLGFGVNGQFIDAFTLSLEMALFT